MNYGLGSIIWYLSCNYLLFPGHKTTSKQLLCFVLDIVVCYLLSYYLIGPYVSRLLLRSHSVTRFFSFGGTENIRGNCEMSVGSLSYALLNYFGQRYFVFSDRFAAVRTEIPKHKAIPRGRMNRSGEFHISRHM